MSIVTAKGIIEPEHLGFTMMHEHLFLDLRFYIEKPNTLFPEGPPFEVSEEALSLSNRGRAQRNMFSIKENLFMDDVETSASELKCLKKYNVRTIVDCTPLAEWGANNSFYRHIKRLSEKTDINIIAACGYYQKETYPDYVSDESISMLAKRMINTIVIGDPGTGVRAGIIGEIGVSLNPDETEKKVLEAVSAAHCETGAPIMIHPCGRSPVAIRLLDFFDKRRVDLTRVIISHFDIDENFDFDYQREVMKLGANIEYDNFGHEHPRDWRTAYSATDWQRTQALAQMVSEGYEKQIFVSSDVCFKMQLKTYGGWGYAHIAENMLPYFRKAGISSSHIDQIFVKNPVRVLDFFKQ